MARLPAPQGAIDLAYMRSLVGSLNAQLHSLDQALRTVKTDITSLYTLASTRVITYAPRATDYSDTVIDNTVFVADKAYTVLSILARYSTTAGFAATGELRRESAGEASGTGDIVGTIDFNLTAATVHVFTVANASLAVGDSLSFTLLSSGYIPDQLMVQIVLLELQV